MKKLSFVSGFIYNKETNRSFGGYAELNQNETITLQEAKELYGKIASELKKDEYIKKIEIDLSNYHEYNDNGTPVFSSEENPNAMKGIEKVAKYYPKSNTLRIYRSGTPIYENADGMICDDEAALCDSLC